MSAEDEKPISFEALEALEDDFEDVELEMIRKQHELTKDLYARREKLIAEIPQFWPLVIEQSPPEIDEFIQPSDAALLMNSLLDISVDRFELPGGDPRSIAIKFTFADNEHFENRTLEKKFYWRNAKDGWSGLVSEPTDIKWKEGKDLTGGMTDLVRKIYDEDKKEGADPKVETPNKKALRELMDKTGMDGTSFFAWFGFVGPKISDEEHAAATKKEEENRKLRKEGKTPEEDDDDKMDEDDDTDEYEWEIFPTADDLAVCIAEDLWPGAIKYFIQANEEDSMSDIDFEDSDEDMKGDDDEDEDQPDKKKRKA